MWRKRCLALFLATSLSLGSVGCATTIPTPPRVTMCVLEGKAALLGCHDPIASEGFVLPVGEATNFLCMPPSAAKELFIYLRLLSQTKAVD